jgi:hypothetical protein
MSISIDWLAWSPNVVVLAHAIYLYSCVHTMLLRHIYILVCGEHSLFGESAVGKFSFSVSYRNHPIGTAHTTLVGIYSNCPHSSDICDGR